MGEVGGELSNVAACGKPDVSKIKSTTPFNADR